MDGFTGNEGVIVLAATNRPEVLDSALLRPGRFDRRITVNAPDQEGRLKILQVHTRKVPLKDPADLEVLAASTAGMVGADLKNLVVNAHPEPGQKTSDALARRAALRGAAPPQPDDQTLRQPLPHLRQARP